MKETKKVGVILSLVLLQLCTTAGDKNRGLPCARGHIARGGLASRGLGSVYDALGDEAENLRENERENEPIRGSLTRNGFMDADADMREVEEGKGGTEKGAQKPSADIIDHLLSPLKDLVQSEGLNRGAIEIKECIAAFEGPGTCAGGGFHAQRRRKHIVGVCDPGIAAWGDSASHA